MCISDWSSDVCSSDLAGEIVDMAVGMVVEQSVTQPQQPFDAQIVGKPGLDLPFRHAGIAIGVEQALFGRDRQAGAVDVDRPALENPVGRPERRMGQPCDGGGDRSEEHTSELQSLMRISYAV